MKKLLHIFFGLSLLIGQYLCNASPLDALVAAQKQLSEGEAKIGDSIKQLRIAFNTTQNNVVDKISDQLVGINKQHETLKKAYTTSEAVRDTLPATVPLLTATGVLAPVALVVTAMIPVFGDAPEIIKSIRDLVGDISDTLSSVRDTIAPTNEKLDPLTDTQETFYKFTKAQIFIKKANVALTGINLKIRKLLESLIKHDQPTTKTPRITTRISL